MRVRRFIVGLILIGVVLGGLSTSAFGAAAPPAPTTPKVPTPDEIKADIASILPAPPAIGVPMIDPAHPQLPTLPYVAVPPGLTPALSLLSPLGVPVCQVGYLGPLGGVVALTAIFALLPSDPPVAPSFLSPLFGPANTLCVLSPFPKYKTCGPDTQLNKTLKDGLPDIPSVGGVSVDVFADVPSPFASVIGTLAALELIVQDYVLNNTPPPDLVQPLVDQIGCSTS